MKRLLFLSLLTLVYFTSCKDEPTPTPVNPCEGKMPFKANFDICEYLIDFDSLYVTDTIANFEVWIRTVGEYDSFKITVGDDSRVFTSKQFKLNLKDSEIGKSIPVKMIGFKKKSNDCFSNEKTVDSLIKNFVVICPIGNNCANNFPAKNEYPFVGKFKGFNSDEPNKEFIVTIVNYGDYDRATNLRWNIQVYNLPNGCGGTQEDKSCGDGLTTGQKLVSVEGKSWGFRSFGASFGLLQGWCCGDIRMWGYVSPTDRNTITIWHRKYDKTNPRKFVGKRI
jgi:hypothetical protein